MPTDFPQSDKKFLKTADFKDNPTTLTYKEWLKKGNEDDPQDRKNARTWKQKIKYQLRYSYPEFAVDEAGEKIVGKDGKHFRNKNWDQNHPNGYTIIYIFNEGELETGSLPLWNAFCRIQPRPGERVTITRSGEGKETKWSVRLAKTDELPTIQLGNITEDELSPDEELPF